MKPSNPVLQHHYVRRVRDFVTDPSSNITHVACAAGGAGACAQADPRQRDCARADQYADDRALREPQGSGLVNDGTEVRGAIPRGRGASRRISVVLDAEGISMIS
jgi:hypothetical protein